MSANYPDYLKLIEKAISEINQAQCWLEGDKNEKDNRVANVHLNVANKILSRLQDKIDSNRIYLNEINGISIGIAKL